MARLIAIAAVTPKGGIGKDGKLIYKNKEDQQFFKQATTGHKVVVGSSTFNEIGKPFKDRETIVLSRNKVLKIEGATVFNGIKSLLKFVQTLPKDEVVFIAGGAEIYAKTKMFWSEVVLSVFEEEKQADTYFPAWLDDRYKLVAKKQMDGFVILHYCLDYLEPTKILDLNYDI